MKSLKIFFALIFFFSIAFSDHRKNKPHKHKKHKSHRVVKHHQPRGHVGFNWRWNQSNHWWHDCGHHQRVVVVKDDTVEKDQHETVLEIIEQIEKLAELKEKEIITEEEYQKKKKELLNRI